MSQNRVLEDYSFQELLEFQVFSNFLTSVAFKTEEYYKELIIEKTMNFESITVQADSIPTAKIILDHGLIIIYNVRLPHAGHPGVGDRRLPMGNDFFGGGREEEVDHLEHDKEAQRDHRADRQRTQTAARRAVQTLPRDRVQLQLRDLQVHR